MKKIQYSDLAYWARTTNPDPESILNITTRLKSQILLSNNEPTVIYVLHTLGNIIDCNTTIDAFARNNKLKIIWPNGLDELNQKIDDTLGAQMRSIDIEQIVINSEASNLAAKALRDVLEIHNKQFTDSITKDQYYVDMTAKHDAIITKISLYEQKLVPNEHNTVLNEQDSVVISTLEALRPTTEDQCPAEWKRPQDTLLTEQPLCLEAEQAGYRDQAAERCNRANFDQKMRDQLSLAKKDYILKTFDKLTTVFNKKIIELKYRHSLLDERPHFNYSQAIEDADELLLKLKLVREAFNTTCDLNAFTQQTEVLFKEYKNKESFKLNRSTPWFRTFISHPFEQLKLFINQIAQQLHALIWGFRSNQYNGTLFSAPETNATKQLNEYHQGVTLLFTQN